MNRLRTLFGDRLLAFDYFSQSVSVQAGSRSCCGAGVGLVIFALVLQYAITQFTKLYLMEGYSVNYQFDPHYYRDQHLELTVGERNEEQGYEFNVMLTALDLTTGRFPTDFDKLGVVKMQQWTHSYRVQEGEDQPRDEFRDLRFNKCTERQKDAFHWHGE